ncbi:MAG: carboxylesterase family protein [Lacunisphaera sp.]|nr:carboxylesterase family protein [Lacunisphaera sp.]
MNIDRRSFLLHSLVGGSALLLSRLPAAAESGSTPLPAVPSGGPVDAETIYGKIRGVNSEGVLFFRGVPYGGPTEGAGRFLPPTKAASWAGVRDALVSGPRCAGGGAGVLNKGMVGQYFGGGRSTEEVIRQTESENCLVLNLLTPSLRGKRPVMVYIHGGGLTTQSGSLVLFAEKHVREQDVVLVGINHRLGVFGYSYWGGLSEKYAVGNVGQLDLVAALEWVRDNIASFGGDPSNVTIFGESGGGAKVSTLMAMPAAKGLFHKACIQSGSMLRAGDPGSATKGAQAILTKFGLSTVEDLQRIPAAELVKLSAGQGLGGAAGVGMVIDGHSLLRHPWDPDAPEASAEVPLLVGNDKDESTSMSLGKGELFTLDWAGLRATELKAGIPEDQVDALLTLYRQKFPKETPSNLYFRISTDRGARYNATKQAELKVTQGRAKVFKYYFQWNTPLFNGKLRAFHTADLPLIMRSVLYPESEQLSRALSGAWAAFARTGDPSQNGLAWPAFTTTERATMVFDVPQSQAVNDPDQDERLMLKDMPSHALL